MARDLVLTSGVAWIAASGCSSSSSSSGPGSAVNVRIVNTAVPNLSGVIDGPGFSPQNISLAQNVDYVDELPGVAGDQIGVDVTEPGGATGSISCRADPTIVGTSSNPSSVYGQITVGGFNPGNPAQIDLICSSGWQ